MIICLHPSNLMMEKTPKEFDTWIEQIMTACKISGRNPKLGSPSKINGGSNRSDFEHETKE